MSSAHELPDSLSAANHVMFPPDDRLSREAAESRMAEMAAQLAQYRERFGELPS